MATVLKENKLTCWQRKHSYPPLITVLVVAVVTTAEPFLPSLPNADTLIVYSVFEVNPVMSTVVSCTLDESPSSGETVTRYPVMVFAPPPGTGAFQLIRSDDSVTSLIMGEIGLSKTVKKQNVEKLIN